MVMGGMRIMGGCDGNSTCAVDMTGGRWTSVEVDGGQWTVDGSGKQAGTAGAIDGARGRMQERASKGAATAGTRAVSAQGVEMKRRLGLAGESLARAGQGKGAGQVAAAGRAEGAGEAARARSDDDGGKPLATLAWGGGRVQAGRRPR